MAMEYTEEQLNHFDKSTLVQLFLVQQSQLKDIDQKLQLLLEQNCSILTVQAFIIKACPSQKKNWNAKQLLIACIQTIQLGEQGKCQHN